MPVRCDISNGYSQLCNRLEIFFRYMTLLSPKRKEFFSNFEDFDVEF